jgi:hypothetical protein
MTDESPAVAIRPAEPQDAEGICAVNVETWLATYPNDELGISVELLRGYLVGAAGEKTAERMARIRRIIAVASLAGSPTGSFVAVCGGRVVGYTHPRVMDDGRHRVGALYERHGFVLTGEEGHDEVASIGSVRIPEVEMLRRRRNRHAAKSR